MQAGMPAMRSPMTRIALGLGLAALALVLLIQGLMTLAVNGVTDNYVRRFMRGTVNILVAELTPLSFEARRSRIKVLDEQFSYPVTLVSAAELSRADRQALARGELVVHGFNRRIYAALPEAPGQGAGEQAQVLRLGPLNVDGGPENSIRLPFELWMQLIAGLGLALAVFALAAWVLRPIWRDIRRLQIAADRMTAGRFELAIDEPESRLFAPIAAGARATLERLAAALASQRELTGAVSHELRTPLARLRFAIDALVDEDDAGRRELAVQACERDIDELDALIDTSLMIARLDMGALQARSEPGDLQALLTQEAASLAPLLEGKQLSTDIRLSRPVRFDARLLPYGLRNALRNAARHARARIALSAWIAEGQVLLAVDDDGEGVPAAMREAVFEPFKRLDRAKERGSRGFGLGLAIVRRVAEVHGGQARMDVAPGLGGARLLISWPVD
ncbi:two-component system sensor histidine kinase RstB [Paucibacter oligotrophus]|uniref:histidine kinase n=1 Tax=Roseateles oligotrophus TaxID=1769250 RepID=A0A840L9J5_9BURK|nr:ATP-binding protein [Roseateles oligotrophus]MBB4842799.1 two-component system sensor histidine kinase RstB [Roseateles oligotrophus]